MMLHVHHLYASKAPYAPAPTHWPHLYLMLADMEKEWSKAQQSSKGRGTRVEALYRDAALSFQEAGRHQAAAEALGRAAVHLEGIEPEVTTFLSGLNHAEGVCLPSSRSA